jgi:hypothetical protein
MKTAALQDDGHIDLLTIYRLPGSSEDCVLTVQELMFAIWSAGGELLDVQAEVPVSLVTDTVKISGIHPKPIASREVAARTNASAVNQLLVRLPPSIMVKVKIRAKFPKTIKTPDFVRGALKPTDVYRSRNV